MGAAYLVITILLAAMVLFSGFGKLRKDPRIVKVIHETVGVPMKYFPFLAACEIAGAAALVLWVSGGRLSVWLRPSASYSTSWARFCRICA